MFIKHQTWIAVLFAIVFPSFVTWVYFILFDGKSAVVGGVCKAIQFAFPACWVFLWMKIPLREAGLPKTDNGLPAWPTRRNVLSGVGLGIAIVAAMFAYYGFAITGSDFTNLSIKIASRVNRLSLDNPLGYAILGGFYAVVHSFLEEYYFRWFVFGRLRELLRFAPAAIVSGLAFMAHHVIVLYVFLGPSLHTAFLSLCIAAGGFIWAWQYERSRSLLGPWISHMIVDTGIFLVGYHMLFVAS